MKKIIKIVIFLIKTVNKLILVVMLVCSLLGKYILYVIATTVIKWKNLL